jgi:hypothetical protein
MAGLWSVPPEPAANEHVTLADRQPMAAKEDAMGKGILLWLLGIPLPIIILLLLFWH